LHLHCISRPCRLLSSPLSLGNEEAALALLVQYLSYAVENAPTSIEEDEEVRSGLFVVGR